MKRIWRIVFTGGPCGGKSTGIPVLKAFLKALGFKVFTIPEVVTIIKEQIGLEFEDVSGYEFQEAVLKTMLHFETLFLDYANKISKDVVILYDRAIMDNDAYMNHDEFIKLLDAYGMNVDTALSRYDAVFHLVTAADGAEEHYVKNNMRKESPAEAKALDKKTLQAWEKHPNLHVFDNSTGFPQKMAKIITKASEIIELPPFSK